ncbi:MAG: hypothetical protein ACHREM_33390, partial [Polyangiales bacterium]
MLLRSALVFSIFPIFSTFTATSACVASVDTPMPTPAAPSVYVGRSIGSDLAIAVVTTPDFATVYVCGGATTFATATHWFKAMPVSGGSFTGTSSGWTLAGSANATGASGQIVAPDGTTTS